MSFVHVFGNEMFVKESAVTPTPEMRRFSKTANYKKLDVGSKFFFTTGNSASRLWTGNPRTAFNTGCKHLTKTHTRT